jgi:hypothetical protein
MNAMLDIEQSENYGNIARIEGHDYEKILLSILNMNNQNFLFEDLETAKVDSIFGDKTTAKSDINFVNKELGFSIKNPKTVSTSIQVSVFSCERYLNYIKEQACMDIPSDVKRYCNLFFGLPNKKEFLQMCSDKKALDYDSEIRRQRCKNDSIEVEIQNRFRDFMNMNIVKKRTLELVFSKGFCNNKEHQANIILWSNSEKNNKSSIKKISLLHIPHLIDNLMKYEWKIRESQTVWSLGPLTLQMKGSGKKDGKSYHSMQFNCSLSDLKKENIHFDGNIEKIKNYIFTL